MISGSQLAVGGKTVFSLIINLEMNVREAVRNVFGANVEEYDNETICKEFRVETFLHVF